MYSDVTQLMNETVAVVKIIIIWRRRRKLFTGKCALQEKNFSIKKINTEHVFKTMMFLFCDCNFWKKVPPSGHLEPAQFFKMFCVILRSADRPYSARFCAWPTPPYSNAQNIWKRPLTWNVRRAILRQTYLRSAWSKFFQTLPSCCIIPIEQPG